MLVPSGEAPSLVERPRVVEGEGTHTLAGVSSMLRYNPSDFDSKSETESECKNARGVSWGPREAEALKVVQGFESLAREPWYLD